MLKTDRLPPATARSSRPERRAWAILLTAFAIFCMLTSTTLYAGYRYATAPRVPAVTAQVSEPSTALVKRSGLVRSEVLVDNSPLQVGDRVIVPEGPPGVAMRLRTGGATVALWPSTSMLFERSDSGSLRLRFEEGQAVIDLPTPGTSLFIAATPLSQEVELTGPGHYRLRTLSDKPPITAMAERNSASRVKGFEIATGDGVARMGDTTIPQGMRLVANGDTRMVQNRWSLVRDGDFRAFDEDQYNATLRGQPNGADTWVPYRSGVAQGANERSGLFYLRPDPACAEAEIKQPQCRNVARFARLGGNEKDSITGMTQQIDADVAAYQHVILEADLRIDYQSLSKGGANGSECPLFARVDYSDKQAGDSEIYFCFWAFDDGKTGDISNEPYIVSQQIPLETWHHFKVDLKTDLPEQIPDLRAIKSLVFYANGHDYEVSVADVSLWAEGLKPADQP